MGKEVSTGDRIREQRKGRGLTLEQLATEIKSSKSYIWEIENRHKSVSAEKLKGIADALETTTDYLLGGTDYLLKQDQQTEEGARDNAFYRRYSSMSQPTKDKLQKMLDLLDDEDD